MEFGVGTILSVVIIGHCWVVNTPILSVIGMVNTHSQCNWVVVLYTGSLSWFLVPNHSLTVIAGCCNWVSTTHSQELDGQHPSQSQGSLLGVVINLSYSYQCNLGATGTPGTHSWWNLAAS